MTDECRFLRKQLKFSNKMENRIRKMVHNSGNGVSYRSFETSSQDERFSDECTTDGQGFECHGLFGDEDCFADSSSFNGASSGSDFGSSDGSEWGTDHGSCTRCSQHERPFR